MASSNEKPFTALVAVDDSARGSDVVQAAATFVRALRGTMVLYRGVSIPPDFTPAGVKSGDRFAGLSPSERANRDERSAAPSPPTWLASFEWNQSPSPG